MADLDLVIHPMTDRWGIDEEYEDAFGVTRTIAPETQEELRAAIGRPPASTDFWDQPVLVVERGRLVRIPGAGELLLETGGGFRVHDRLPVDLPTGYHELRPLDGSGRATRLIVSPGRCYLPPDLRVWGWSAQLYATRSTKSWGMGDFADLRRLGDWAHRQGAGVLLINPVSAVAPTTPQDPSPYSPSSRRYFNPLYLRIEEIQGAGRLGPELGRLAASGRALNADRRIDRDRILDLKRRALETLWQGFRGDPAFDRYRDREGQGLRQFATYCTLAERHGGDWRRWPPAYRRPDAPEVHRFADDHRARVSFHAWTQWLLEQQLAHASHGVRVMHDLPVGFSPGGADAWIWQDVLAGQAAIGAPPDLFNEEGQDWGLPPFAPHKLRDAGYGPVIETIRTLLRHAGGLRIDHVMGLFRLWWVPSGRSPREGAYVRYPGHELLAVLALESQRARAVIAGEDLGTVDPGVRQALMRHDVLSYRLVWFEEGPPEEYPVKTLAAVTTHDLPTLVGIWTGADLDRQRRLGLTPDPERWEPLRRKVQALTGLGAGDDLESVVEATYARLGGAPSAVVLASLDDACLVAERPNMPGAPDARENWSLALPLPLDALETRPLPERIARALTRHRAVSSPRRLAAGSRPR